MEDLMDTIETLIRKTRSIRRFYQDHAIGSETLKNLVNLGRLSGSGANLQPLKYIISTSNRNARCYINIRSRGVNNYIILYCYILINIYSRSIAKNIIVVNITRWRIYFYAIYSG